MNKPEIMLLCASSRRKGTSAMLLERIRLVTGGEVIFLPQKGSLNEVILAMQQAAAIVIVPWPASFDMRPRFTPCTRQRPNAPPNTASGVKAPLKTAEKKYGS